MIKVVNSVPTYDDPAKQDIRVCSHCNRNNMVIIEIGDDKHTVKADEIKAAIDNATNTKRF